MGSGDILKRSNSKTSLLTPSVTLLTTHSYELSRCSKGLQDSVKWYMHAADGGTHETRDYLDGKVFFLHF